MNTPTPRTDSRLPWRVTKPTHDDTASLEIWTRFDDTVGSRNNYAIATGIQTDEEAILMASAPELLEALQEIADRGPVEGYTTAPALMVRLVAIQSIARAAIAKAKGE